MWFKNITPNIKPLRSAVGLKELLCSLAMKDSNDLRE